MTAFDLTDFVAKYDRPAVIVPLTARNWADLQGQITLAQAAQIDLVEWRIDLALAAGWSPSLAELKQVVAQVDKPILLTWRTTHDGGDFAFDLSRYVQIYDLAIAAGVWGVDVEFWAFAQLADKVAQWREHVKIVVSAHDFDKVPQDLTAQISAMDSLSVDVVKFAGMVQTPLDVTRLFDVGDLTWVHPLILLGMGELGQTTRTRGWQHGSQATFAALTADQTSAPGQLIWQEMAAYWVR